MSHKIIKPEGIELIEYLNMEQGDIPPAGCRACGGPYPYCKTSCKLFDD